jgi:hypothetical protein
MNKYIGIIGHGADKFTYKTEQMARATIAHILRESLRNLPIGEKLIFISGHSPVGGIDIWGEEIAKDCGFKLDLKIPKQHKWDAEYGYKQRNIDIAKSSDEVHVILVDKYPPNYKGMRFGSCYHCNTFDHVKSGACWTGKQAKKLGKKVIVHIIKNGAENNG